MSAAAVSAADASTVDLAIATLKAGAGSPNSSIQGSCANLANLAAKPGVAAMIEQKGAMVPILDNLARLTGKHPQAVAACFAALVNLTGARPSFKNALIQGTDAIAAAKIALIAHLTDESCQLYGLWVLANLSLNDAEGLRKVLENDGIKDLIEIFKANAAKPQALRLVVAILGQVAHNNPALLEEIVNHGTIELVTDALRAHAADAKFVITGSQALHNIIHGGAGKFESKIAASRCIDAVIGAMQAHGGDTHVQQAGIGMLTVCLANNQPLSGDNCAIVVAALQRHSHVTEVASAGCMLLGCAIEVLYDGGKGLDKLMTYLPELATKGSIEAVVKIMNTHSGAVDVCRSAAAALQNLAIGGINNQAVAKAGGLTAIIQCLLRHMSNIPIQNAAFAVLNNCLRDAESVTTAANAGAVDAITKVVNSNLQNPDLARRGLALLGQLGLVSDEVRASMDTHGGIKCIVAALKTHHSNPSVLEAGISALRNITFAGANTEECRDAGAIPVVLEGMRKYPKHVGIQHAGCGFIVNMSLLDEESRAALAREGAADIITLALQNHSNNPGLVRSAGVALSAINQALDDLKQKEEAARRAREEAEAKDAAQREQDAAAAAAAEAKLGEIDHTEKTRLARSRKLGRVQDLIDLFESGDLYIWDPPKKVISLKN